MLSRRAWQAAIIYSLVLFLCPLLYGQATGSISGTVSDATGAAVSGAKVTVTAEATGLIRDAVTDQAGHYIIPLLGVANYTVRAELKGFQTVEQKDVRLQVDEQREVNFILAPASVQQTVEVSATPVAVETTNPTLGQVITSQQVAELPLNGRDFVQLATLTPGTIQETNPGSFFTSGADSEVAARGSFSLSVGGSRANSTDWLLDGNDNNELTAGGIAILPSIDAIQEFKVLTYNYSAEWGTRAGPTVLVTTKSGTNTLHGSLFEFFRNTSLDARSFFATNTEKFNLNQFGGSIGGPIRRDKTFFFADIQNKFQRHGIPFTGLVPSAAMRTGDFTHDAFGNPRSGFLINPNVTGAPNTAFQCDSAGNPNPVAPNGSQSPGVNCNKIPAGLINPIAAKMINFYPLPDANNPALGYNYVNEPVRKLNEGEFDVRVDHNFSTKDTAFARFSYDQAVSYVPGGSPGFAEASPFGSNQGILNHGRNVAASETHVFSPNTVNQISGGYNRIFNYITSQGSYSCISNALGIPGANLGGDSCGMTSTQLDGGYWSLGDRGYSPFQGGTNVFSIADSFDMVRGNHDIKVGGEIRANQMNVRAIGFQDGYWIFTGAWGGEAMADFLLGLPSLAIHDQTFDGDITGRRWKMYRPFVQDDWRVTRDLTLNLGLGWALVTPITEAHNRQADFDPSNHQILIAGQNAGASAGIQMDKTDLEPRIGIAWKPFGSQNTVIRGGYAIFHDAAWSQGAQGLWQNPPFFAESGSFAFSGGCTFATAACATLYGKTPSAISMSSGFPIFTSPPTPQNFAGAFVSQNLDFKHGRVQQFNVNVERQIPGNIVLTLGYAGSRSSHILLYGNNLNIGSPAACGVVSGYTLGCGPGGAPFGLPYPQFPFSTIYNVNDIGRAHYNSFQVKAETKSSRYGLYGLIGYTYASVHDNGFTDGLGSPIGALYFPLPGWQKLDWALSQINLNHDFTASVIYQLPFGKGRRFGSSWSGPLDTLLGHWELTVIEKATSGFPIFIVDSSNTSGVNFQNDGNSFIRPNQTCNPSLGNSSLSRWFNTGCFAQPPADELGNASRTPVSGPDFINTDFSVIKHFPLPREATTLDFRAEFFNLFNHPQFGLPGADFNSPATFGAISSTVNNPRVIQFALKLLF
ncbi:MAG: carboxypeptidase regulatory-like domain-containing protein [Acidobacteriaceae bacterium]|nr:carboxypeptidase regulatory-like domain-containing protein [Acidobacteriaceae bacterium]MBV9780296.1 carboxypeptidase regulatory-like domain-containing protein [Acidobacteriaceae bacterium]